MAEKKSRKKTADTDKIKKNFTEKADAEENVSEAEHVEEENKEVREETSEKEPDTMAEQYLEMLRRERADFANYKKRNESLASQSFLNGVADVIEKLLPALDNFDRAMAGADENDSFVVGIRMIQKQLSEAVKACGVTEIDAEGKAFNPEFMDAVMQVEPGDGMESGSVAEVLQKGYIMNDRVIRHSVVKVVK